jgi:twitching motility protein PilT
MTVIQEPPVQEKTSVPAPRNLEKVLRQMLAVSDKVSDLIFSPGRPPQVELVGKLQAVTIAGAEKLSPAQTFAIGKLIIGDNTSATESLDKFGSADLSFSVPGLCRFRVNVFKQRGTHAIVMRVIP